jgi:hypothetical protein
VLLPSTVQLLKDTERLVVADAVKVAPGMLVKLNGNAPFAKKTWA